MNTQVLNTSIEKLLFFDCETVARNKELDLNSKEYELFQWKQRDKEKDTFLTDEELSELYKRKAALYPIYNKVVCISVAYVKENTVFYKSFTGEEKEIIESFYNILQRGDYTLVSFNGIAFDLPTIRLNALKCGVEVQLNSKYQDSGEKPWTVTSNHIDLMNVFKGTYYYNLSLDEVCYLMDVDSPKEEDVKGSGVSEEYYENGVSKIANYCNKDTIALVQIVAKLKGCFEGLLYEDRSTEKIEVKPVGVLERIYLNNKISGQDKKELREILKGKALTKKNRDILIDMIYNLSINSDFMNKDKPEVKKEKLETVVELIKNL